jgi:hypothetical protein
MARAGLVQRLGIKVKTSRFIGGAVSAETMLSLGFLYAPQKLWKE